MPFLFEPFSFGDADTADGRRENLFAPTTAFDPGLTRLNMWFHCQIIQRT